MTTPDPSQAVVPSRDPGNMLLQPVPTHVTTDRVRAADGTQYVVMTFRTASTTMTVMFRKADARMFLRRVQREVEQMTDLITGNGIAPHG